jgi:MFS family permease
VSADVLIPALTSLIALFMALALADQWRERRHPFQLTWAVGMLFFGIASGCEAIASASGWTEALYRSWYLTGAVWTAGWLGLGTAFLLGRTRFGYAFALGLFLAGVFTLLTQRRYQYPDAGSAPVLYLIAAAILAVAIAVETYFQNERWPRLAALAIGGATALSVALMATTELPPPGYAVEPVTGVPTAELFPGTLRLLTPFLNITGGFALAFGAIFSAYVFMPKKRILTYSLDPNQKGDEFLFNLLIAIPAITVNFGASLPGAVRALFAGRLHSRVPATILIAIGAFTASSGDILLRFGIPDLFFVGKLVAVVFLLLGFLISVEAFAEFRIPFTRIVLVRHRRERTAPPAEPEADGARA